MPEKTPESPLDSKGVKPANAKGGSTLNITGRTDAEAETPVFWLYDVNRRLIGKVPDAGKDRRQKEKRISENEMAGRHHQCNEHELGQTLGDGEGFPSGSAGKKSACNRETWIRSLGWEDSLEKGMATHSSILHMENSHGQRSLVGYSSWGHKESDMTGQLNNFFS